LWFFGFWYVGRVCQVKRSASRVKAVFFNADTLEIRGIRKGFWQAILMRRADDVKPQ
jgi:hypothetical protein